jgi:hypothetical protein
LFAHFALFAAKAAPTSQALLQKNPGQKNPPALQRAGVKEHHLAHLCMHGFNQARSVMKP